MGTVARQRFDAAVYFISNYKGEGERQVSFDDSVKLTFYGMYKSATEGPCHKSRPSLFDVVGRAKFDAWASNGEKSPEQAMIDYVSLLDKLHAPWRTWDGIPAQLRGAIAPELLQSSPSEQQQTPKSAAPSVRSASSGIYGDFTSASSAGGRNTTAMGTPVTPSIPSGFDVTPVAHFQAPLEASSIEGTGARSALNSSSGAYVDSSFMTANAQAGPPSTVRTAIRWSLSPNSAPTQAQPTNIATADIDSRQHSSSVQIGDMCASLAQSVEKLRAEVASASALLQREEGELAMLQAAYAGAVEAESRGRNSISSTEGFGNAVQLNQPRKRGLFVSLLEPLRWWLSRLLRRRIRSPIVYLLFVVLVIALVLRLRRGLIGLHRLSVS